MRVKLVLITTFLDQVKEKLLDRHSLLAKTGELVSGEVEENFRQKGRPKWAGNRPLVKTGKMKSQATKVRTQGNLVHIGEVLDSLPYPSFIHNGTRRMLARPFMGIPNLAASLLKLFRDHILGG
jgi:phage gpG-like protein